MKATMLLLTRPYHWSLLFIFKLYQSASTQPSATATATVTAQLAHFLQNIDFILDQFVIRGRSHGICRSRLLHFRRRHHDGDLLHRQQPATDKGDRTSRFSPRLRRPRHRPRFFHGRQQGRRRPSSRYSFFQFPYFTPYFACFPFYSHPAYYFPKIDFHFASG